MSLACLRAAFGSTLGVFQGDCTIEPIRDCFGLGELLISLLLQHCQLISGQCRDLANRHVVDIGQCDCG